MTRNQTKATGIGDSVSDTHGRTDEGTPVSLADFAGRALAVFFLGERLDRTQITLTKNLKRRIDEFFEFECSPIVVSTDEPEILSSLRDAEELPFLLISDTSKEIHTSMCGSDSKRAPGSFVINDKGEVAAVIPVMAPREQVSATIAAISRIVTLESS